MARLGWAAKGKGSHYKFYRPENPGRQVVVSVHGGVARKDILRKSLALMDVSVEEFLDAL